MKSRLTLVLALVATLALVCNWGATPAEAQGLK